MRSIGQRYDTLATDGDTGSASGTRVFTLFVPTFQCPVTSHPPLLDISAQMQGVGVPASDSMPY